MTDFERRAASIGLVQKEVPFALANALTYAAYRTKDALAGTEWPKHVQVRNTRFLKAALDIEPAMARDFREGRGMKVEIFDALGHVDLKRLAMGGVKSPKRGGRLAIPTQRVQRGGSGAIRKNQTPRGLNPKNVVIKDNLLFVRVGRGKNKKLQLAYKLRPNAKVKPTVPFYSDFQRLLRGEVYKSFPVSVRNVLKRNRLAAR